MTAVLMVYYIYYWASESMSGPSQSRAEGDADLVTQYAFCDLMWPLDSFIWQCNTVCTVNLFL